ncbi:FAD-dependent oxidoreductase [Terriglobus aquaticus]|uniref:D-amino-acid oxidase n=1 Tax=Terriglobus aquaticus TaxID=940139 RepID=A0ABW9KFZ3_9BACT|nr:FAD-dependent oxidoreductase [Terriglobus aquaticus]
MPRDLNRRAFLQGSAALTGMGLVSGCAKRAGVPLAAQATAPGAVAALPFYDMPGPIVPIRADMDRIFRITVCLRPFRAAGPRLEVERIADATVVHNYGHGGSGWSLSWGAADQAVRTAMQAAPGTRDVAVIGCGAIGLTAALTAQRMGLNVTIYAKERPPYVRSSRATGQWTPDSRIALANVAAPDFAQRWEQMARFSFGMYQSYLGSPGSPIEWTDRYFLEDPPAATAGRAAEQAEEHQFARYRNRIADLTPQWKNLPAGVTPFPTKSVRQSSTLTFNVASYSRQLMQEFQIAGGRVETREFHSPGELAQLTQKLVIHCTGYGARALFADESVVPVRGQIAWLIPQEGVNYAFFYNGLNVVGRRDGIVIQPDNGRGDEDGWNRTDEEPDRAEAEGGVRILQELYGRMKPAAARRGNA